MNFIIASFYTRNTPYEEEIKTLLESCEKFGYETFVTSYPSHKSWELNCWLKPVCVLEAMNQHPDKNIFYLDSDAVIMKPLDYIDTLTCEIGCHNFNGVRMNPATLFLKNTIKMRAFVAEWYASIVNTTKTLGELHGIQALIKQKMDSIDYLDLPLEYAKIFDSDNHIDPVVQQNQASRRFKSIINTG